MTNQKKSILESRHVRVHRICKNASTKRQSNSNPLGVGNPEAIACEMLPVAELLAAAVPDKTI